jgi:hypothetical protein
VSFSVNAATVAGEPFAFPELVHDEDQEAKQAAIEAAASAVPAAIKAGGFPDGSPLQVVASGHPGVSLSLVITKLPEEA